MSGKLLSGVSLGCALAFVPANAAAQEPRTSPVTRLDAADTLTLDVKDQPLVDVVKYIRTLTGRRIVLGEGPHGTRLIDATPIPVVTVQFEDVAWQQALRLVAESADCLVRREGAQFVLYRPTTVTIEFERADLRDVVQAIAAQSGANLVIGTDVPEGLQVSVRLRDIPWEQALNAVVKSVGMTMVRAKGSSLMRIGDPERITREARSKLTPEEAAHRQELARRVRQAEVHVKALESELAQLRRKLDDLMSQLRGK